MTAAAGPRTALRILLVASAYFVCGKLGLLLAIPPGYATAVWPASGMALAAGLLWGYRIWPGVLLGSFLVNISTSWDASTAALAARSLVLALVIGAGAATQAMAGTWLISRRRGYANIFTQETAVFRILMLGGPVSCLINASIGVGALWLAGLIPGPNLLFNAWTWWIGDSIGVLIFTPLVCAWSLRPREPWLRKQIALSLPTATVFAAVVGLFFFVSTAEQRRLSAEFEDRAADHIAELQKAVAANLDLLTVVRSYFEASEYVSRAEFTTFVSGVLYRYPAVQTLSWIPRVESAHLASFEQAMRDQGLGGYRVYDLDADGRAVAAAGRAIYFPLAYLVPYGGNERALGYDAASEPLRRSALERALRSGEAAATPRLQLRQDTAPRPSVILYLPIYHGGHALAGPGPVLGLASAVIRIDELARTVLGDLAVQGLQARIFDGPVDEAVAPLWTLGTKAPIDLAKIAQSVSLPIRVADRNWTVQVLLPADYVVAHRSWQAWGLLAVGLSLTALLEVLLLVLLARQSRVEELVASRTAELREAEQRFRGLLEAAPDAMLMIDDAGRIDLVNRQAELLFGYTRSELVGRPIGLLMPAQVHRDHASQAAGDPQTLPMATDLDLSARRRDGSEFPVDVSLGPVEIGTRSFAIAAVRDASERTAAQRKLASYAVDLERSNKELEQFAYVASHDLQAPLRGVMSFAQLLKQRYVGQVLEGKGEEFLQHIELSARHMEALIRDLLAFSRVGRQDQRSENVDCERVLIDVLTQIAGIAQQRQASIVHEPLPTVRGSRIEIFQLLQNLIVNGLKFQPGEQPRIRISAARDGQMWRLSIQDFGIGIASENQERIFRIFRRLQAASGFEGTGIGLAICQKIVAGHGGRIWVESSLGQGATFHFTLPAAEGSTGI